MISSEPAPLAIAFSPDKRGNVVVVVQGEIDLATADQFQAALVEALAESSGQVVIDLAGVSFLDSQAISTLIRVHKRCDRDTRRLMIRSPQPAAKKLFELSGLDQILRIDGSVKPRPAPGARKAPIVQT